ncbi:MAG TPA: hypothetical protein VFB34_06570, partial [Chloroflexota bacterium]|nr:hypothetical protein [Chloroflexota bacterium]
MTESPFNGSPLAALPPEVVTLIPYPDARRLKVAAIAASDTDVTVLIPDPGNAEAIEAVEKMTSLSVTPIETSTSSIDGVLDRLSGSIDDSELWLQRRHIQALGRLVDHSVNLGKTERVRPLVDRALEFAPYSAELWLMEARLASQRRDVIHALRIASQIAPDDRRILRWIQSFDEVSFADESAQTAAESGADSESPAQAVDEDLEVAPHADEDEEPGNSGATLEQAFVAEVGAPTIELPLETPAAEPTAGEDGSPEETERPSTFETTASGEMVGEAAAEAIAE